MSEAERTAEQVLADWRGQAAVLRKRGHVHDAELLEQCAEEISNTEPVRSALEWLSEGDARLKSGYGVEYFRSRFTAWRSAGLAELRGRRRFYRGIIVPQREHPSVARAAGFRGERFA